MEISHFMQVFFAGFRSSPIHMSQRMTSGSFCIFSDMFSKVGSLGSNAGFLFVVEQCPQDPLTMKQCPVPKFAVCGS